MRAIEAVEPPPPAASRKPRTDASQTRRLLERLRAGDRTAAETLVAQTYEGVFAALCRMTGDGDLASDLTQETYARAWKALDSFHGRCKFSTWLYRIAYTTFLNHIRGPKRIVPMFDEAVAERPDPAPSPEAEALAGIEAGRLRRAVLDLPEELRYVVTSRFWGEVPVREIARAEQVTGAAIRKRLKKALHQLHVALEEGA